jgi:hypothetical protein
VLELEWEDGSIIVVELVYMSVCVCVCVCVRERGEEREDTMDARVREFQKAKAFDLIL